MILLLVFVSLNPQLPRLLLVCNDFIETFDAIIELCFGEFECFLDAILLGLERLNRIELLIVSLVELFDFRLALVQEVVLQIDHIRQVLVAFMFILQLCLNLVTSLVHRMELVNEVIVVSPCLIQLLLHLVVVNLQGAQFQLVFITSDLLIFEVTLQCVNLFLTLSVHLRETDHLSLIHLQLTSRALQILHQSLGLLLIDVEQLLRFLQFKGQVFLFRVESVVGADKDVHLEFHLYDLLLGVLYPVAVQV